MMVMFVFAVPSDPSTFWQPSTYAAVIGGSAGALILVVLIVLIVLRSRGSPKRKQKQDNEVH
jgi:hypothetical protein